MATFNSIWRWRNDRLCRVESHNGHFCGTAHGWTCSKEQDENVEKSDTPHLNKDGLAWSRPYYNILDQWCATMQHCRAKCAEPDWFTGHSCMRQALRVRQLAGHPRNIDYTLKVWIFSRATNLQLSGHFWPAGHGLHTLSLDHGRI